MESVAAILQLDRGFVHRSANCEDLHPELAWCGTSIPQQTVERPRASSPKRRSDSATSTPASCPQIRFLGGKTIITDQKINITAALEEIVRKFAPRDRGGMALTPETRLVDDFGIDSPRMIDVVLEVEDRFGISVDDDAMARVRTFGEVLCSSRLTGAEA